MDPQNTTSILFDVLMGSAVFILPPLLVATLAAFVIALFQAITQIQDQTLPQTIKIIVIGAVLVMMGGTLAAPLQTVSDRIFTEASAIKLH